MAALERADEDAKMDMSPMIDMVFLLLIFFMVASRMITVRVDPEIEPPVADQSIVPRDTRWRIIFNIRADGTYTASDGSVTVSEEDITERVIRFRDRAEQNGAKPSLLLRAHKDATVRDVKKVTKAAAMGGINKVVFGAFQTDR
jgi:biopolymer transport protein ExbD